LRVTSLGDLKIEKIKGGRCTTQAPLRRSLPSQLIRDKVLQRSQEKRTKLAAARVGDPDGAFLEELDEKRLGEISRVLSRVTLST
jgi:hypothetical protein